MMLCKKTSPWTSLPAGMDSAVIFGLIFDSAVIQGRFSGDGGYQNRY